MGAKSITTIIPHDPAVKTYPFSRLPISKRFKHIYKTLKAKGILGELKENHIFPDIPQFFSYACARSSGKRKVNTSYGHGGSDDEREAVERAISEAIEHYCILNERPQTFIHGTYRQLKTMSIDPLSFTPFTKKQLSTKKYKRFNVSEDMPINWLTGHNLLTSKKVLVPASLAYANYSHKLHNEPVIRMPISTGAACGPNNDFAIYRGLCEIIERDSYMISFQPKMQKKLIFIDRKNKKLNKLLKAFHRYNFEVYFFDTTQDTQIFSVVCLLVDRTGNGPAVCCGLGAGLNVVDVMMTSAIEALRRYITNRNSFFYRSISNIPKKGSFEWFNWTKHREWSAPHMINQVEHFIKTSEAIEMRKTIKFRTDAEYSECAISAIKKVGCTPYYIDMTIPEVEGVELKVAKVLVPEMVPLWHDERYPYFGVKRLIEVPKTMGIDINLDISTRELINNHPF